MTSFLLCVPYLQGNVLFPWLADRFAWRWDFPVTARIYHANDGLTCESQKTRADPNCDWSILMLQSLKSILYTWKRCAMALSKWGPIIWSCRKKNWINSFMGITEQRTAIDRLWLLLKIETWCQRLQSSSILHFSRYWSVRSTSSAFTEAWHHDMNVLWRFLSHLNGLFIFVCFDTWYHN